MYNILDLKSGNLMLGEDVPYSEMVGYLNYYKRRYAPGTPYENGKGCYDCEFVPVMGCDCCGEYSTIH